MAFIPHTVKEKKEMFEFLGIKSIEELFLDIPQDARFKRALDLLEPMTEFDIRELVKELNNNYKDFPSFLGGGEYRHFIP